MGANYKIKVMTKNRKFYVATFKNIELDRLIKIFEKLNCKHIEGYNFECFGKSGRYPNFEYENQRAYDYCAGYGLSNDYDSDKQINIKNLLWDDDDDE